MNKYLSLSFIVIASTLIVFSKTPFFGVLVGFLISQMYQSYKNNITTISPEQIFLFFMQASILVLVGGKVIPEAFLAPLFVFFLGGMFTLMFIIWWKS